MGALDGYEPMLTTGEVATLLRVDRKTAARWAVSGKFRTTRTPGGHIRFYEKEIMRYLGKPFNDPRTPAGGQAS